MACICYVSKQSDPLSGGYRGWPTTKCDFANNVLVLNHVLNQFVRVISLETLTKGGWDPHFA